MLSIQSSIYKAISHGSYNLIISPSTSWKISQLVELENQINSKEQWQEFPDIVELIMSVKKKKLFRVDWSLHTKGVNDLIISWGV
jgi:hypothetical protein